MDGFKVATINQLIDLSFIIYALVVSLLNTAFASVMVRKFMQILQSSGYRGLSRARVRKVDLSARQRVYHSFSDGNNAFFFCVFAF